MKSTLLSLLPILSLLFSPFFLFAQQSSTAPPILKGIYTRISTELDSGRYVVLNIEVVKKEDKKKRLENDKRHFSYKIMSIYEGRKALVVDFKQSDRIYPQFTIKEQTDGSFSVQFPLAEKFELVSFVIGGNTFVKKEAKKKPRKKKLKNDQVFLLQSSNPT